jgi:hypothetical protein
MLDLKVQPPFDWDEIGEWEGPTHELEYDMFWSDEGIAYVHVFVKIV